MSVEQRRCCDCGKPYPGDVRGLYLAPGWVLLHVSNRLRCRSCADSLDQASLKRPDDSSSDSNSFDFTPRRSDPAPEPSSPFRSGGGGDFAGAGATTSYQPQSQSSQSCSSSSSSDSYSTSSSDTSSGSSSSDTSSSSSGGCD